MTFFKNLKTFIVFFISFIAFGQMTIRKHYTAFNKLPNNNVRCLFLDKKNTLWIGTDNGIVAKHNNTFTHYFMENGLAFNSCWAITQDRKNQLWFGSYGNGLTLYKNNRYFIINSKNGLIHNEINRLFAFKDYLYVGTSDGLSIIDIRHPYKILNYLLPKKDEKQFKISGFFSYHNKVYCTTVYHGVFAINVKNQKIKVNLIDRDPTDRIFKCFVNKDTLYLSNEKRYSKYALADFVNPTKNKNRKYTNAAILWDYTQGYKNQLYAVGWGMFEEKGGLFLLQNQHATALNSKLKLQNQSTIAITYDQFSKRLYVGSNNDGLYEIACEPEIVKHALPQSVLMFASTKNQLASLSSEGVRFHQKKPLFLSKNTFKRWHQNYLNNHTLYPPSKIDYELIHNTPAQLINFYELQTFGRQFWLTTNIGIFNFSEAGKLLQYLPIHAEKITFTPSGKLIDLHPHGGVKIYPNHQNLQQYKFFSYYQKGTPTLIVKTLQTPQKTYLLSCFTGLYSIKDHQFHSYFLNNEFTEGKIRKMVPFGNNLVISTEFGDIYIVNDQQKFKILHKIPRAKINGNNITFLKTYQQTIVIGTEKGITLYKNGKIIFLDEEQGLTQPIYEAHLQQHQLLVGTHNGYYQINLKKYQRPKSIINHVGIQSLTINNIKYKKPKAELNFNQNALVINLKTNQHPYPNKLRYSYKIKDQDPWSAYSNSAILHFPYLAAGKYHLRVKILDTATGNVFTKSLYSFTIHQPFWKTWWFIGFIILIVILLVVVFMSYRFNQQKKFTAQKNQIEKRLSETKMEALLAQMNPHFTFNAMNTIQHYILANDNQEALTALGEFSRLIRTTLNNSFKSSLYLYEEIAYLESYIAVESKRFGKQIQTTINVTDEIDEYQVKIPNMLLQPFVENAFKHAFPPSVSNPSICISFSSHNNQLLCSVQDNGVGMAAKSNSAHQSKGMLFVKERLQLLDLNPQEVLNIQSTAEGTTVTILLPIN